MLEALERHPAVRLALHYSGPLLGGSRPSVPRSSIACARSSSVTRWRSWAAATTSRCWPRCRNATGSASCGAWAMSSSALFGRRPTGAWLAERVWEPDLPTSLVAGGYAWTILDDAHFRAAAIPEEDLWGPYTTEDQGRLLRVFGTEQGLRYRIPFREVGGGHRLPPRPRDRGRRAGRDDGRRRREVRAWPTTWEHCWGEGRWVDRFFEALEANADWLSTTTPSAWLADHPPDRPRLRPDRLLCRDGRMGPARGREPRLRRRPAPGPGGRRPEARWLRGAFWRNFQVKYREINDLHKQMLRTSDKVEAMTPGPARDGALDHLYQGQSNDCYWHGLFGGIYISHMRLATYEHLIAAEDLADAAHGVLDSTESARPGHGRPRRGPARDTRAGRHGGSRRGRRDRRLGHPAGPPRGDRRAAAAAGGVPRDAAPTRSPTRRHVPTTASTVRRRPSMTSCG